MIVWRRPTCEELKPFDYAKVRARPGGAVTQQLVDSVLKDAGIDLPVEQREAFRERLAQIGAQFIIRQDDEARIPLKRKAQELDRVANWAKKLAKALGSDGAQSIDISKPWLLNALQDGLAALESPYPTLGMQYSQVGETTLTDCGRASLIDFAAALPHLAACAKAEAHKIHKHLKDNPGATNRIGFEREKALDWLVCVAMPDLYKLATGDNLGRSRNNKTGKLGGPGIRFVMACCWYLDIEMTPTKFEHRWRNK